MKAIVCKKYGPPAKLQLLDLPIPVPAVNEVLVRVRATTINDWDWSLVRGKPYFYRTFYGLLKPKQHVFGVELAGTVEDCGPEVTQFKQGDLVYGDISMAGWGGWAEYATVPQSALAAIPQGMSFEEATSLPHASILAYQGLLEVGQLVKGQKVLINGAGGGMGTFAMQIAKTFGAEITGVDSGDKLNIMKEMGFDHVIDYRKEDFTKNGQTYDLVLDAKTTRSPLSYLRSLKPEGKYVTAGGYLGRILQLALVKKLVALFSNKSLHLIMLKPNAGLEYIQKLYDDNKITPLIDGPYQIEEIPKLLEYFGKGNHHGKIVISLGD